MTYEERGDISIWERIKAGGPYLAGLEGLGETWGKC